MIETQNETETISLSLSSQADVALIFGCEATGQTFDLLKMSDAWRREHFISQSLPKLLLDDTQGDVNTHTGLCSERSSCADSGSAANLSVYVCVCQPSGR